MIAEGLLQPRNRGPIVVLHARVVTGAGGGPDKTILSSGRYLAGAGYEALCAYLRHPEDPGFGVLLERAAKRCATVVPVDDSGPLDWRVYGRVLELCRRHRPAIWHGHDYKSNLLGVLVKRSFPIHLVTTVHGWVKRTWKTPLYYAMDRYALRHYDRVICVSRDLQDLCLRAGVPSDRCSVIPNGIDTVEFSRQEPAQIVKSRLGLPPGRVVLGAVGRLSAEKGFESLILAVASLVDQGLDVELRIAGEGDEEASLKRLAKQLALEDRVVFEGFEEDMLGFYHALDVFVLSSSREGLPNVLLEAMALEVPVVSTRVAGVPDVIQDGQNGLLVENGSPEAICSVLEGLVREPETRRRIGAAGRETVEASYRFDERMSKLRRIYDEMLQNSEHR